MFLHVQDSSKNPIVVNVEVDIRQKIVVLNVHIVSIWDILKSNVGRRMEFRSCNCKLLESSDEEVTLIELNRLCGVNNNIFLGTKVPMHRNPIGSLDVDKN
jgi:hypothetical protein